MAALTADTTRRTKGRITTQTYAVAASTQIFHGALVALNASGFLVDGSDTANLKVVGVALDAADNSSGGDGDLEVEVYRGAARVATSGASSLVQADVGGDAFILDDNTVVKAAGVTNNIIAGEVLEIEDASTVWVNFNRPR